MSNLSDWKEILAGWQRDEDTAWEQYCDAADYARKALKHYLQARETVKELTKKIAEREAEIV